MWYLIENIDIVDIGKGDIDPPLVILGFSESKAIKYSSFG